MAELQEIGKRLHQQNWQSSEVQTDYVSRCLSDAEWLEIQPFLLKQRGRLLGTFRVASKEKCSSSESEDEDLKTENLLSPEVWKLLKWTLLKRTLQKSEVLRNTLKDFWEKFWSVFWRSSDEDFWDGKFDFSFRRSLNACHLHLLLL